MDKMCSGCGGAIAAPQMPDGEAEMCAACAAPQPEAAVSQASTCEQCAAGTPHDHA